MWLYTFLSGTSWNLSSPGASQSPVHVVPGHAFFQELTAGVSDHGRFPGHSQSFGSTADGIAAQTEVVGVGQ